MAIRQSVAIALASMMTMCLMVEVGAILSKTSVVLENGGYTGVVVAIDETIKENNELVEAIKTMFSEGSKFLYQATKKRVYFKNVTILIPSHWSNKTDYGSPGRLNIDTADVRIALPNPLWGPDPYTQQIQGCGKPGSFIHFIEEFLTNPDFEESHGKLGRVLVHEWGHLRWGLFDEYPDPIGDQNDVVQFYQSVDDGKFKPVVCSLEHQIRPQIVNDNPNTGTDYRRCEGDETRGYEPGCLAIPYGARTATGSIMYGRLVFEEIVNFCDDEENPSNLHNREAPNKHNRLCNSLSAWEVMRGHGDFTGDSPQLDLGMAQIVPTFNLVQSRTAEECRIVLVLDTSGSMSTADRIQKVISASTVFVNLLRDRTWVGIASFTDLAVTRHDLVQVTSEADRESLRNALLLSAVGGTNIGIGLQRGLEILQQHPSGNLAGGVILLMTDGEDNGFARHPVRQAVLEVGVRVDTLAVGKDAYGELNKVAEETDGNSDFYADDGQSDGIITALEKTSEMCSGFDIFQQRIQLQGSGFTLNQGETRNGSVWIDSSIGNDTRFIVTYTNGLGSIPGVSIIIIRPDGENITVGSPEYINEPERKIITISVGGKSMSGEWMYYIENRYAGSQSVTFSIYSRPIEGEEPIVIQSEVSSSTLDLGENIEPLVAYAQIRKGFRPVLNASVKAIIERPQGYAPIVLKLEDNGAGADVTANDGVYSRSFIEFSGTGYYGITIIAENNGQANILYRASPSSRSPAFVNITEDGEIVSQTSIGGFTLLLPGETASQSLVLEKAAPFSRGSSAGSTNIPSVPTGFVPGQDLFPPNRVQDLRVGSTSVENLTLALMWTAPGDDLDIGTASFYEIRFSNLSALLLKNFSEATQLQSGHVLRGNTSNPKPFGSVEEYVIRVPDVPEATSFSYAIALRATDEIGQTSLVSNLALATFRRSIPTPPPLGPCDGLSCLNGGSLNNGRCFCSCPDEYQGHMCQHVKSQLRHGVQIHFEMNLLQCRAILDPLRGFVAERLAIYCNDNSSICCPRFGAKTSPLQLSFVSKSDVRIADGYPVKVTPVECYVVVFAIRPDYPDLCVNGSGSRRRRKSVTNTGDPIYVSQDILFAALSEDTEALEVNLTSSSPVVVISITLPIVEDTDGRVPTTPTTPAQLPEYIIAVVVIAAVVASLFLLLVFIFFYKKSKKNESSRSKDAGDNEL